MTPWYNKILSQLQGACKHPRRTFTVVHTCVGCEVTEERCADCKKVLNTDIDCR